jgi:hypothetical protein
VGPEQHTGDEHQTMCRHASARDAAITPTSSHSALLGIDQKTLAARAGVSGPTIQRMEASNGDVRGVVGSLIKIAQALDVSGIELIGENKASSSGRFSASPARSGIMLPAPPHWRPRCS